MNKFSIIISVLIICFIQNLSAKTSAIETIEKPEILVGFYGRPNTPSLGILGENNIDELVIKMQKQAEYFNSELNNTVDVKLAFHIIHSLATRDPGRRNDYLLGLQDKSLMRYINRAEKEKFAVIIDVQLGTKTPYEAVLPILKYLKYDNVHIAIDPEFKIPKHRRYPPGKFVGHIFAKDLNKAQEAISEYMIENKIEGKRDLIVHMFHKRMLREKQNVKNYENINLVYNIDGHGRPAIKITIYNNLYNKDQQKIASSGFKIFNKTDSKPLMTPKQIIGLEPVNGRTIKTLPYYINYH